MHRFPIATQSVAFHLFPWNEYLAFSEFGYFCSLHNTEETEPISHKLFKIFDWKAVFCDWGAKMQKDRFCLSFVLLFSTRSSTYFTLLNHSDDHIITWRSEV